MAAVPGRRRRPVRLSISVDPATRAAIVALDTQGTRHSWSQTAELLLLLGLERVPPPRPGRYRDLTDCFRRLPPQAPAWARRLVARGR